MAILVGMERSWQNTVWCNRNTNSTILKNCHPCILHALSLYQNNIICWFIYFKFLRCVKLKKHCYGNAINDTKMKDNEIFSVHSSFNMIGSWCVFAHYESHDCILSLLWIFARRWIVQCRRCKPFIVNNDVIMWILLDAVEQVFGDEQCCVWGC